MCNPLHSYNNFIYFSIISFHLFLYLSVILSHGIILQFTNIIKIQKTFFGCPYTTPIEKTAKLYRIYFSLGVPTKRQ